MRTAIILVAAVLGGCAVVPPSAWTFDPDQPRAKSAIPAAEFAALGERVAQLKVQRRAISDRIAADRDVWQRQRHYEDLHRVGRELSPLEDRRASVTPAP